MLLIRKTDLTHKATLALAILTGLALRPVPASAQAQLTLGQSGSTTLTGTATLTNTGTTAGGTYSYTGGGSTPLASQNSFQQWTAYGPSTANISGGYVDFLYTYDTSTADISGGSIGFVNTYNTSTTNVAGGSISNLTTHDTSTTNVTGGRIGELATFSTSTVNVSGGSITGNLQTINTSTIDLFGTGFSETFLRYDSQNGDKQFNVRGTLQNGNPINVPYFDYSGTLEFNGIPAVAVAAPEPSQFAGLGFAVVGTLGLILKARSKLANGTKIPAASAAACTDRTPFGAKDAIAKNLFLAPKGVLSA